MVNKVHFEKTKDSSVGLEEDLNKGLEKVDKSSNNGNIDLTSKVEDNTYKRESDPSTGLDDTSKTPTSTSQKLDKSPTNTTHKTDRMGINTPKRFDKTFSVALTQALLTSDTKLLHKLLSTKDVVSIQDTVSELTPPLVLSLLEFILSGLVKSPNQLYSREGWINSILRVHNTLFTNNSRAKQLLVRLNKYIVSRLSVNRSLLKLKGKVDGLVYMVSMCNRANSVGSNKLRSSGGMAGDAGASSREPLVTFSLD